MKKLSTLILILLSILFSFQKSIAQLNVIEYKLDNGFTVILNPDPFQNEVAGAVAVNTGSKNDPADATGISHYLEHLLFKGTDQLGTADYAKEKPHLDSINYYYDRLGETEVQEERVKIQTKINQHAVSASQYGMPNEFDKLLKSIGSTRVNATTSNDLTIYYNNFPANQVEKWLNIYSHRFINPVFRSFQSELEVVYEEKNRAADNMQRRILESFKAAFYEGHPYGEKTTLGSVEHLKNPSLTKMYAYFKKYYVANNMALILSGNFDVEMVKPLIVSTFGQLKSAPIDDIPILPPVAFNGRKLVKERLTPIKVGIMGFQTAPAFHTDELTLELCSYLFQNESGTGLIDELKNENKLMMAFSFQNINDEAGNQIFVFIPKVLTQSLKKVEKLVLTQIEKVKDGKFSDNLLQSVKNEMYKNYQLQLEDINSRTYIFANLFRNNKDWNDMKNYSERIEALSKNDIIKVAKKYYGDNYLVFQSRTGFPKKEKLGKPKFKPVQADQSRESEYAHKFKKLNEFPIENKFIDFETDLIIQPLKDSSKLFVVKNPVNDIYELSIRFRKGILAEPKLEILAEWMNYAYPKGSNLSDFKTKLSIQGTQYSFQAAQNYFEVKLEGIERDLEKVLQQINNLFQQATLEEKSFKIVSNSFKTERKTEEEDPLMIARAIAQYGLYGDQSVFLNRTSLDEIKNLNEQQFVSLLKDLLSYSVSIHYTGKSTSKKIHSTLETTLNLNYNGPSEAPYSQPLIKHKQNEVLVLNNTKLLQSHLFFVKNSYPFQEEQFAKIELFNTYFGGGFSGILTQEIREYRSLAYSSSAKYRYSSHPKTANYFYTYIGCQADKTLDAALTAYDLIQNMPKKPERLENIQQELKLNQLSNYPTFRDLSTTVELYQIKGFKKDPNEAAADMYKKTSFEDLYSFYQKMVQQPPTFLGIYGDAKRFELEQLSPIGKVREIKRKEVVTF